MSWSGAQAMGLVVPSARGHEDDPILVAYPPEEPRRLGERRGRAVRVRLPRGLLLDRRLDRRAPFSMTSFPDGTALLLDRGEGVDVQPRVRAHPRPHRRAARVLGRRRRAGRPPRPLGQRGRPDRARRRGRRRAAGARRRGRHPYRLLEGSAATGSGNRGALVLPLADRATTRTLADAVVQPAVPDGWSALYARAADGSGRLAVARWGGPPTAELRLADPRGAPVTQPRGHRRRRRGGARRRARRARLDRRGRALLHRRGSAAPDAGARRPPRRARQRGDRAGARDGDVRRARRAELRAERVVAAGETVVARVATGGSSPPGRSSSR